MIREFIGIMKPIMFESLRNLLKSRPGKSKPKDKGVDASFKRSDSFKRISIRKSYLDRGRNKRLAAQQKLSQAAAAAVVASTSSPVTVSAGQPPGASSEGAGGVLLIDLNDINNVTTTKQLQLQQKHFVKNCSSSGKNANNNDQSGANSTDELSAESLVSGRGRRGGNRIGVVDASIEHQNKCKHTGRPKTSLQEITEILSFDKSPRSQRRSRNDPNGGDIDAPATTTHRNRVEVQTVRMDFDRLEAAEVVGMGRSTQSVVVDVITNSPVTTAVYDKSNAVRLRSSGQSREQLSGDDDCGAGGSLKYVNSLYLTGNENETVSSIESSNGQHNDRSLQSLLEDTSIEVVKRVGRREFERISEKSVVDTESCEDREEETFEDSIEQMPSLVTFKTFMQSKEFSAPINTASISTAANGSRGVGGEGGGTRTLLSEVNVSRTQVTYEPINTNTFKISNAKKNRGSTGKTNGVGGEGHETNKSAVVGDVSVVIKIPYSGQDQREGNRRENGVALLPMDGQQRNDDDCNDSSDETTTDSSTVCDDSEEKDRDQTSNYVSTYEINLDYPSYLGNIDEDIISSDGNMPYPLRMKTNPFTHQKELYAVNLGRIWKQLNLGQHDEDFSIDSIKQQDTPPTPQLVTTASTTTTTTTTTNAGKPFNNESFKSMSSRDSGFSLTTLTKSESLFRRKARKAKESSGSSFAKGLPFQRNSKKPKLAVSRDGYFKRVMIQQKNSTKRKKLKQRTKLLQQQQMDSNLGGLLLQDFEEFCKEKVLAAAQAVANGIDAVGAAAQTIADGDDGETSTVTSEDSFKKEMRELEAFYEAHLLRLKDYYLKRKELNEATITDFYNEYKRTYLNRRAGGGGAGGGGSMLLMRDYTQMQREVESQLDNMDIYNSPYIMARNETLRRKISLDQQERMLSSTSPSGNGSRFSFPHPDKRKRLTTSTESLVNQFSRFTRRGMFSQQSNSTSATSTRSQPVPRFFELRPQHGIEDDLKYAELVFQNNSYNGQQQQTPYSSMTPVSGLPPIITPPTPFRRGFLYEDSDTRKISRKDRNFFFKNIKRFMHQDPFMGNFDAKVNYVEDPFVSILSEQEAANKHEILLSNVFPSVHHHGHLFDRELMGDEEEEAEEGRHHDNDLREGDAYPNCDPKRNVYTTDCDSIHTIDANSCDFCFNFKHFCDISDDKDDGGGSSERAKRSGNSSVADFQSTISNCNCNFLLRSKRKKKKGQKLIAEAADEDNKRDVTDTVDGDVVGDAFQSEEWFDYEATAALNGAGEEDDECGGSGSGKAKVKRRRSKKKLKKRKSTVRRIGKTINNFIQEMVVYLHLCDYLLRHGGWSGPTLDERKRSLGEGVLLWHT